MLDKSFYVNKKINRHLKIKNDNNYFELNIFWL